MRRIAVVGITAMVVIAGFAAGASAQVAELVEQGEQARYSGEQTVVCNTPDGRTSEVFEVAQAEGVAVSRDSAGVMRAAAVTPTGEWNLAGKYEVRDRGDGTFLQRPVAVVEIIEGEILRLRLRFDLETGVLLASDVYNGDGTPYCSTRFVVFVPGDAGLAANVEPELLDLSSVDSFNESALPEEIAGFDRISVGEGPREEIVSAYYGDGIFSFTVLNAERVIDIPELAEAPTAEIEGHSYRRQFTLSTVVVEWSSDEGGYVLIGNIPLDVQSQVLRALPTPSQGFFDRLWSLFN